MLQKNIYMFLVVRIVCAIQVENENSTVCVVSIAAMQKEIAAPSIV